MTWRDLATLTFDLGGHGACRCGSLSSVCVSRLKFVGLLVRKIWRTSCLSISRPGDLDLWPWNWCALLRVGWTTFLPILVFLGCFVLDLSANTCQTRHMTLLPWPLILEVTALVDDAGLHTLSVYQVWSSQAFPFRRYWEYTVWALIGLVTLTFELLTSK